MTKFQPKGREELRKEVVSEDGLDIADIEENKDLIDRTVERLFKEEEFKASEKNKTAKAREELERTVERKEFYKNGGKPKGDKDDKTKKSDVISLEDKSYMFGRMNMTRTEVRHLEKVMLTTGKKWEEALKDNLFTSFKRENDTLITRRNSGLPSSRGGGTVEEKTLHTKLVDKYSKSLPKEFAYKPK